MNPPHPTPANRAPALGAPSLPGAPGYLSPVLAEVPDAPAELPYRPDKLSLGGVARLVLLTRHQIRTLRATPVEARAAWRLVAVSIAVALGGVFAVMASGIGGFALRLGISLGVYGASINFGQFKVTRALMGAYRRHFALGGEAQGRRGIHIEDLPFEVTRPALLAAFALLCELLGWTNG